MRWWPRGTTCSAPPPAPGAPDHSPRDPDGPHPRQTLLERFRAKIAAGRPLIGGGAGTGLSAKCEEAVAQHDDIGVDSARRPRPGIDGRDAVGIATPEDAQLILAQCPGCDGFYGASSMERLPAEVALTETTRRFVSLRR